MQRQAVLNTLCAPREQAYGEVWVPVMRAWKLKGEENGSSDAPSSASTALEGGDEAAEKGGGAQPPSANPTLPRGAAQREGGLAPPRAPVLVM
jgi:hypothetical protein